MSAKQILTGSWNVVFTKRALVDAQKIKKAGLKNKVTFVLKDLREDPYQGNICRLVGDLQGCFSQRVGFFYRVVYQVYKKLHTVKVLTMWIDGGFSSGHEEDDHKKQVKRKEDNHEDQVEQEEDRDKDQAEEDRDKDQVEQEEDCDEDQVEQEEDCDEDQVEQEEDCDGDQAKQEDRDEDQVKQ